MYMLLESVSQYLQKFYTKMFKDTNAPMFKLGYHHICNTYFYAVHYVLSQIYRCHILIRIFQHFMRIHPYCYRICTNRQLFIIRSNRATIFANLSAVKLFTVLIED